MVPIESVKDLLKEIGNNNYDFLKNMSTEDIKQLLNYIRTHDMRRELGSRSMGFFSSFEVHGILAPTFSFSKMEDLIELEHSFEEELKSRSKH